MFPSVKTSSVCVLMLAASACALVPLTPGGGKVRVLGPEEASACQRLGEASASVIASAGPFNRLPDRVQQELDDVARNSAADMGGDTVVRVGEVRDGRQTFHVYRCVPAAR